jgi:hypothetical protein
MGMTRDISQLLEEMKHLKTPQVITLLKVWVNLACHMGNDGDLSDDTIEMQNNFALHMIGNHLIVLKLRARDGDIVAQEGVMEFDLWWSSVSTKH